MKDRTKGRTKGRTQGRTKGRMKKRRYNFLLAEDIFHSLHPPEEVENSQVRDERFLCENRRNRRVDFVIKTKDVPTGITGRNLGKKG